MKMIRIQIEVWKGWNTFIFDNICFQILVIGIYIVKVLIIIISNKKCYGFNSNIHIK